MWCNKPTLTKKKKENTLAWAICISSFTNINVLGNIHNAF